MSLLLDAELLKKLHESFLPWEANMHPAIPTLRGMRNLNLKHRSNCSSNMIRAVIAADNKGI